MLSSIINRMILLELVKVFLMSLTALTGLFLLAGLIQEAAQRGLAPHQILMAIPLLIPNTLPYTIPATTLFATCVVYGRMSADNEVLVLRTAGVNILHLLKPALLLGIVTSATTMFLYYDTIPRSRRLMREKFLSDMEEVIYGVIKREGGLRGGNLPYSLYVREVRDRRLIDVIFKRRNKVNNEFRGYDLVARTREARLKVDMEKNVMIIDLGRHVAYGEKGGAAEVTHDTYSVPLPEGLGAKDNRMRRSAMTWEELLSRRGEAEGELAEAKKREEEGRMRYESLPPGPEKEHSLDHYNGLKFATQHHQKFLWTLDVERQMRPALAAGCLCFVLIGCPVGIWASRSDYLSTFVICFLPTTFLYYPLVLAGGNLAKDGKIPPIPASWAADILLGTIAIYLICRLMRR